MDVTDDEIDEFDDVFVGDETAFDPDREMCPHCGEYDGDHSTDCVMNDYPIDLEDEADANDPA